MDLKIIQIRVSARFKLLYKNPELYQEREKVLKIKYFQGINEF